MVSRGPPSERPVLRRWCNIDLCLALGTPSATSIAFFGLLRSLLDARVRAESALLC